MELLRELSEISSYAPQAGYSLDLWRMVKAGKNRSDSLTEWRRLGRSDDSFRRTVKALKEALMNGADFGSVEVDAERVEVWERYAGVQKLLLAGKKKSAVVLSVELLVRAKKLQMTEVVAGLSSMLEGHFGGIEFDARRYVRYGKMAEESEADLAAEQRAKRLWSKLLFWIEKGRDLNLLKDDILMMEEKQSGSLVYVKFRYAVLSIWFRQKRDKWGLAEVVKATMAAYAGFGSAVSARTYSNLYFVLVPVLCETKSFGEAELAVSKALAVTSVGNHNWHLFMLQKACVGIQSGKPGIAMAALRVAMEAPKEHNNRDIERRWALVQHLLDGKEVDDIWKYVLG